jgi:hypothetical protein
VSEKLTDEQLKALLEDGSLSLAAVEKELDERRVIETRHDPLGHVQRSYPWGEKGTELEGEEGPREWQKAILAEIRDELKGGILKRDPLAVASAVIRKARASGHGIGKSALVAWVILWAMETMVDCRGIVTANTATQLASKTWPEVSKWFRLHRSFSKKFDLFSESIRNKERPDTWRFDRVSWTKEKPEAFQGLHNKRKRIVVIFDEASAIADEIWEATEGALTDANTEIIWLAFGNPTRIEGRFRECFRRHRKLWDGAHIDSRDVPGTNLKLFAEWVETYGEDSDFVRVRVRGMFPRASAKTWIDEETVEQSAERELPYVDPGEPLVMGIDVARGGDDQCVIRMRRGLDARTWPTRAIPGSEMRDSMQFAAIIGEQIDTYRPDAVFVDATAIGGPVFDRLMQLGYPIIEVQFGGRSPEPHRYANMRMYMWAKGKEWLLRGGCIEPKKELIEDLKGPEYHHDKHDRLVLESKDAMKKRGLPSPDDGDSLFLTLAAPVAPRQVDASGNYQSRWGAGKAEYDWDPLEDA